MLLKQGAHQQYATWWRQYVNGWVMGGYAVMFATMMLNIFAMSRGVQVKEVSIIESMSYLFVPALSFVIFQEKLTWRKVVAIAIIITGVIVFFAD
jgi:drug/metabolite transporter (DMT)-like permease